MLHLHTSREPAVTDGFTRLESFWSSDDVSDADSDDLERYSSAAIGRYIALDDRAGLERTLAAIITSSIAPAIKYSTAQLAADRGLTAVATAILAEMKTWLDDKEPPHYASRDTWFHLGGALAQLSPTLAAQHCAPVWQRFLAKRTWEEASTSHNTFRLGTAVLVPLLGSSAKAAYVEIAKTIAGYLDVPSLSARKVERAWLEGAAHLLRGLRLSGDPFAKVLADRFATFKPASRSDESDQIRAEVARILPTP